MYIMGISWSEPRKHMPATVAPIKHREEIRFSTRQRWDNLDLKDYGVPRQPRVVSETSLRNFSLLNRALLIIGYNTRMFDPKPRGKSVVSTEESQNTRTIRWGKAAVAITAVGLAVASPLVDLTEEHVACTSQSGDPITLNLGSTQTVWDAVDRTINSPDNVPEGLEKREFGDGSSNYFFPGTIIFGENFRAMNPELDINNPPPDAKITINPNCEYAQVFDLEFFTG